MGSHNSNATIPHTRADTPDWDGKTLVGDDQEPNCIESPEIEWSQILDLWDASSFDPSFRDIEGGDSQAPPSGHPDIAVMNIITQAVAVAKDEYSQSALDSPLLQPLSCDEDGFAKDKPIAGSPSLQSPSYDGSVSANILLNPVQALREGGSLGQRTVCIRLPICLQSISSKLIADLPDLLEEARVDAWNIRGGINLYIGYGEPPLGAANGLCGDIPHIFYRTDHPGLESLEVFLEVEKGQGSSQDLGHIYAFVEAHKY